MVTNKQNPGIPINSSDQTSENNWVLSSLEHDQLVRAKKHPIPRRHLKGTEWLCLGASRLPFVHDGSRLLSGLDRRPVGWLGQSQTQEN